MHVFEELCDEWTYENIDGANLTVNLHRKHNVGILYRLKRGMNQRLVKVQYESFTASFRGSLRPEKVLAGEVTICTIMDLDLIISLSI